MIKFKTKEDKSQFDKWSKEEIYLAYLQERETRVKLNEWVSKERLKLKQIEYDVGKLLDGIKSQ
jgi:hypothetical protein